jgi:hypothetical protein
MTDIEDDDCALLLVDDVKHAPFPHNAGRVNAVKWRVQLFADTVRVVGEGPVQGFRNGDNGIDG